MPTLHQTFTPVTIHTAKCDICNQHNRSVLFRCADCGWHVCTPCWTEKGGDGTHVMNEGAKEWRGVGAGAGAERARRGAQERRGRDRDRVGNQSRRPRPRLERGGEAARRNLVRVVRFV